MGERRAALVTGSTSGIGLGIATAFAKGGMDVTLNGLGDAAEIEKIRSGLEREAGVSVRYDGANLMQAEGCASLVEGAIGAFGRLDVLVNNAGIQHVSPIEDFPVEKYNAIIALNLSAAFLTIRSAMRSMKAARYGRIINIASAHGHVASPFKSAYVAAKHGIIGLTKTGAVNGGPLGVRVNCVAPGLIVTRLTAVNESVVDDAKEARQRQIDTVPLGRSGTVEEVASVVAFLFSDDSSYVTGVTIPVEGGSMVDHPRARAIANLQKERARAGVDLSGKRGAS